MFARVCMKCVRFVYGLCMGVSVLFTIVVCVCMLLALARTMLYVVDMCVYVLCVYVVYDLCFFFKNHFVLCVCWCMMLFALSVLCVTV